MPGGTAEVPLFALSSSSVYPESTAHAFAYADRLGYDAVEVMVGIDAISQDIGKVRRLRDYHEVPVCAVHAPCLLVTQRVWGTDPWVKLEMSAEMAHELGADVVVVHPPFRWQRDYARGFVEGRFSEDDLDSFRQEKSGPGRGLSSYPHPPIRILAHVRKTATCRQPP